MQNNKKGSSSIIIMFVVLILLPSFILVPITSFIIDHGGIAFLELPIFAKISAFIASFSTIFGLLMIYRQIEKDKKIMSSRFLVSLNDSMMSFNCTRNVHKKLLDLEEKKYDQKFYEKAFKTDVEKYDFLFEYFAFFENLNFFLEKKIIKISELNDMFSKRFFLAVNNKFAQQELLKNPYSYINIFKLSKALLSYKYDNDLGVPFKKYSIDKVKNFDLYSKDSFNYKSLKNNILLIFIFSSTLFLFLLFFILLSFNYPINSISSIISTIGTVIGAFSIIFQLDAENNINKARFLFDLNKSFISKDNFKEINVLALYNINYNKKFNNKKNIFKNIGKENVFNYLTFFESLNVMIENKALTPFEVSSFFGFRFFVVVNNPYVQDLILIKDAEFFRNIYKLHKTITNYRIKNNIDIVYKKTSLDIVNKNYNKIISEYEKSK